MISLMIDISLFILLGCIITLTVGATIMMVKDFKDDMR
jgi:hypothetical protein